MGERVFAANPLASAGGRVITSPFQFVTEGEDNLRVSSWNSLTGVRLQIAGRRFDEKGRLIPFVYDHMPTTDRTRTTTDFALGAGALVNLQVSPAAGAPLVGQTYVMVQLIRGFTGATIVLGTLLAGYVSVTQPLGWPGSPIVASTDGRGALRAFSGTNPLPGSNVQETVPANARWRLQSVSCLFSTAAGGAARLPVFGIISFAAYNVQVFVTAGIPASSTGYLLWAPGLTHDLFGGATYQYLNPLPVETFAQAGDQLSIGAENMQIGDNFDAPALVVEEWIQAVA